MTIGIFLDSHHINYPAHLAFLTAQADEYTYIKIYSFDNLSKLNEYDLCDVNIFLNRFCYIDFEKLQKKYITDIYSVRNGLHTPMLIVPKNKIKKSHTNTSVLSFINDYANLSETKYLNKDCYLKNLSHINSKLGNAIFICFNDYNISHIEDMKNCYFRTKDIFYENRIYKIDPLTQLMDYKDTQCCKINKNLWLVWNNKTRRWNKLPKGVKVKC